MSGNMPKSISKIQVYKFKTAFGLLNMLSTNRKLIENLDYHASYIIWQFFSCLPKRVM
jgi:hypothetical protein